MSIIGYLLDNSSIVKELKDSIEEGVFRDLLNPYDSKNIDYNFEKSKKCPPPRFLVFRKSGTLKK